MDVHNFLAPFNLIKNKNAFTLLELVLSVSILIILLSVVSINIINIKNKDTSQDSKKVMDLFEIDRVVNEYLLDNSNYPGTAGVLYTSDTTNWIPIENLNKYISNLPIDTQGYTYKYIHNGKSYEINAYLIKDKDKMFKDNGNNDEAYEIGNNLLLIE